MASQPPLLQAASRGRTSRASGLPVTGGGWRDLCMVGALEAQADSSGHGDRSHGVEGPDVPALPVEEKSAQVVLRGLAEDLEAAITREDAGLSAGLHPRGKKRIIYDHVGAAGRLQVRREREAEMCR